MFMKLDWYDTEVKLAVYKYKLTIWTTTAFIQWSYDKIGNPNNGRSGLNI